MIIITMTMIIITIIIVIIIIIIIIICLVTPNWRANIKFIFKKYNNVVL